MGLDRTWLCSCNVDCWLLWVLTFYCYAGTNAELYEWSCSATGNNSYTLPDLRGNTGFPIPSLRSEISIYPLPSVLNCNGTVIGVNFSYWIPFQWLRTKQLIFTLLTLKQNGSYLNITDIIPIYSTPMLKMCPLVLSKHFRPWRVICFDYVPLNLTEQFYLPARSFAFGIHDIWLLQFHPQLNARVEHHRLRAWEVGGFNVGSTISVDNTTSDRSLKLFAFRISKLTLMTYVYNLW
jgi:hypothetical protein